MAVGFRRLAGSPATLDGNAGCTIGGVAAGIEMVATGIPTRFVDIGCSGVATGGGLFGPFGDMAGATGCSGVVGTVEGSFPFADMGVATTIGAWGLGVLDGDGTGCGSCFGIDGWTVGLKAGIGGAGGEVETTALLGLKTVGGCTGLITGDGDITGAAAVVFTSRFCAGAD